MEYQRDVIWLAQPRWQIGDRLASRDFSNISEDRARASFRGTRGREHEGRPVFRVPNPPAWSSATAYPSQKWGDERYDLPSPSLMTYSTKSDRIGSKEPSRSPRRPTVISSSAAAPTNSNVVAPPPTPRFQRLPTPDLEPLDGPICACRACRQKDKYVKQTVKLDSQRDAALRHIRESSTVDPGGRSTMSLSRSKT
ncbi:hypothetical protein GQ53DRAFT_742567 [Thozetella sp. PMI_491]|nr:hypothetical protein GQ53DRAFT_742567 [Thozetella sp. PMI_491]